MKTEYLYNKDCLRSMTVLLVASGMQPLDSAGWQSYILIIVSVSVTIS